MKRLKKKQKKSNLDWKAIYILPRIATVDTTSRVFQYKLLNNVLFLNKMLYQFGILPDSLCPFCSLEKEIPMHIFYSSNHTQIIWKRLTYCIQNNLDLPSLKSQIAIVDFTDSESENSIIINHLLIKVKTLEEDLSNGDNNKSKKYRKKWQKISDIFV